MDFAPTKFFVQVVFVFKIRNNFWNEGVEFFPQLLYAIQVETKPYLEQI